MSNKHKEPDSIGTEHWMDKRIRLGLPINYESNVPRVSAETLVKLNNLKNKLQGTDYTLYEASKIENESV